MRVTVQTSVPPGGPMLMLNEYGDVVDFVYPRAWLTQQVAGGREEFEVHRTLYGWCFKGEEGDDHG